MHVVHIDMSLYLHNFSQMKKQLFIIDLFALLAPMKIRVSGSKFSVLFHKKFPGVLPQNLP